MRHSFLYIPALFAITACGNMDDFPELAAISEQEETEVTVNLTDTIRINETPLSGEVETVPSATAGEDGYKDFVENFLYDDDSGTWDDGVKTLEVTFTDDGATYVFKNKNGKVKELDTSTLNVTTDEAETIADNALVAVTVPTHINPSTYDYTNYCDYTNFMLKSGKFIRIIDNDSKMPANKAYLQIETTAIGSDSRGIVLDWGDAPTAIETVGMQQQDAETVYDLQGRKITGHPSHGIYIINGKKNVIR